MQRYINVMKRCSDVVSTSDTDVVLKLCNVENPTSDFVSLPTLDQSYLNVDPKRWNNIDPTLNVILLGITFVFCRIQ